MKYFVLLFLIIFSILLACNSSKTENNFDNKPQLESDTIRIANKEIEYEVLIIDIGFSSWFNSNAKPRNYYS
jgi:hypothetical protein